MSRFKQSISWWCFADKLTPEQLVRAAVDIGYQAVELVSQEYWSLIKDHGLTIASIDGHSTHEDGLNRRENRARIEREIRVSIELAVKWGIPNLICFSGNRHGLDDTTGAEIAAENLRHVAKMAEDAGVTLLLEMFNSKVDHPDYQADSSAWGIKICQMVGSPRVRLLYDIYHMQIMEGDIIRTIRDNHAYFAHYHTAGVPGRHEIDDRQELNYRAIMRTIAATGYEGYVGQEFVPTSEPIAALKAAFDLCNVGS
jgi:hydroxypyruvate isomerase